MGPSTGRPTTHTWKCLLWLAALLAVGCSPEPEPPPPSVTEITPAPAPTLPPAPPPALLPAAPSLPDPMMSGAHLSRHLPTETVAYLRLPNPWASLGDVVGRPSDAAYASVAWRQQLELLKSAVGAASQRDHWPSGLAEALIHINGPVEAALLQKSPEAGFQLWLTARMNSPDPAPIEAWLSKLQVESEPAQKEDPADLDGDTGAAAGNEAPAATAAADPQTDSEGAEPQSEAVQPKPTAPAPLRFAANGLANMDLGLPQPALLKFDAAQSRLHLLLSLGPDTEPLTTLLATLDRESVHPARSQIEDLDQSGRGMAAWVQPSLLLPHIAPAETRLRQVLALSTGWSLVVGTVDGHGQISVSLAGLDPELLARLPKGVRELPVTSAADPDWAVVLALPSAAEWESLRSWLAPPPPAPEDDEPVDDESSTDDSVAAEVADYTVSADADATDEEALGEPAQQTWMDQLDERLRQISGISAATLFSRIGPELAIWHDSAGTFGTLRVKDPDGLDSLLANLSSHLDGELKMRRWNGMDIHEYSLALAMADAAPATPATAVNGEIDESHLDSAAEDQPPQDPDDAASAAEPATAPDAQSDEQTLSPWRGSLERLRTRAYWVEEGPFLIAAQLPQVLADRQFSRDKTTLQSWLKDAQTRDPAGTIAMAVKVSDNLQRDSYHGMITALQALGDILEVEIDPYAFPNADELRLPEQGSISARIGVDGDRLSFSLSYEDSPAELLRGGGGMATMATAGILAAIAIPAYEDFQTRSQLRSTLQTSAALRGAIDQYQQQRRRWPNDLNRLALDEPQLESELGRWQIEDKHLVYDYSQAPELRPILRGARLSLVPDQGQWQCAMDRSSIAERLLLAICPELDAPAAAPAADQDIDQP